MPSTLPFRFSVALSALALVLLATVAVGVGGAEANPYSGSTLYTGGGKGLKVTFRVRGKKVILAHVHARLNCTVAIGEQSQKRHFGRRGFDYASPTSPLRLGPDGGFRFAPPASEEESFTEEERLIGQFAGGRIAGRFHYYESMSYRPRDRRCQTGLFPFEQGETEVAFIARRR